MLYLLLIKILALLLIPFLAIISLPFEAFDFAYDISAGAGYVFGNMYLLDGFLPISDLFLAAGVVTALRLAFFYFDFTMWTTRLIIKLRMLLLGSR